MEDSSTGSLQGKEQEDTQKVLEILHGLWNHDIGALTALRDLRKLGYQKTVPNENLRGQIADTYRNFSFWQDKQLYSVNNFEAKFKECADEILALISNKGKPPLLSDEEIMGGFCKTCGLSLDGCIERGGQSICRSYREALRQKKKAVLAQRELDKRFYGGIE